MHLTLVGLSHKTAPVEIRERLTFPAARQEEALSALTSNDVVAEAVVLSTCNRTEVYAVTLTEEPGKDAVVRFLSDGHDIDAHELIRYLYFVDGAAVVRHLFRVAASLDSMVVGEAQILGQVKEAYELAFEHGGCSRIFNKLFRQSFEVGKRVRTETEIGESAVSISYAAVELAKKVFDDLVGRSVFVIGAGEMSELTARHLKSSGVEEVLVANRTHERAVELAKEFGGEAIPFDDLFERMTEVDIVITSTAATHYVVSKARVEKVMRARPRRPLFLIDIAVPRDIEPEANEVGNVFVYDIDDLNGVVESNLEERMREARRAERIIDDELEVFAVWIEGLEVVPTIAALRAQAEHVRQAELEKALKRLSGLSEKEVKAVEALSGAIVNKMLHGPTAKLKQGVNEKDGYVYVEAVRHLYGLDEPEARKGYGELVKSLLGLGEKRGADEDEIEMGESLGC